MGKQTMRVASLNGFEHKLRTINNINGHKVDNNNYSGHKWTTTITNVDTKWTMTITNVDTKWIIKIKMDTKWTASCGIRDLQKAIGL